MAASVDVIVSPGIFGGKLSGILVVKQYLTDPTLPRRFVTPESIRFYVVKKEFDEV